MRPTPIIVAMGCLAVFAAAPAEGPRVDEGIAVDVTLTAPVDCGVFKDIVGVQGANSIAVLADEQGQALAIDAHLRSQAFPQALPLGCDTSIPAGQYQVGIIANSQGELAWNPELQPSLIVDMSSIRGWDAQLTPLDSPTTEAQIVADGLVAESGGDEILLVVGLIDAPIVLPHQAGDCLYRGAAPITGDLGYAPGCPGATSSGGFGEAVIITSNGFVPNASATTWHMTGVINLPRGTYGYGMGFSGPTIDTASFEAMLASLPPVPA